LSVELDCRPVERSYLPVLKWQSLPIAKERTAAEGCPHGEYKAWRTTTKIADSR